MHNEFGNQGMAISRISNQQMDELWRYFNEEYWEIFQDHLVLKELPNHRKFYDEIRKDTLFDDDIYQALAALSFDMFQNKPENYRAWLHRQIPVLENRTPAEVSRLPNGMNWLREYIIRSR